MKKKLLFLLVSLCFIFINVQADGLGYYLSTENANYNYVEKGITANVKRGDIIYVTSVINDNYGSNYTLENGSLTLRWDSNYLELMEQDGEYYNLKKSSMNLNISSISKVSNKININYTSNTLLKMGKNNLFEFKFRVLDKAKIGTTKIYEMDGENTITCKNEDTSLNCGESYLSELYYNILSSNVNTLSNIKINGTDINNFNENTKEYNISVNSDIESINIEAIKKDSRSSISGDLGTKKLQYGLNVFKIIVTSEANTQNTYVLNITRPDLRSKINTLDSIKLSKATLLFKKNVNDYNVTVSNEIDKMTITTTLTDTKSKYLEDYSKKEIDLQEGMNKITITVIAENGTENTYTINITRELSGNNTLKGVFINGISLPLKENEFNYYYEVENDVKSVKIEAVPTNSQAKVNVLVADLLDVGDNDASITVTAPNGKSASYFVNIYRKEQLSNNSKLRDLKIANYKLNFNPDETYYYLTIGDEETLDIETILDDEKSDVSIEGNRNLIDGSIIKINVKAENGSVTRYFINIEKSKRSILPIILIILLLLALIPVIIIIIKKRKGNNNLKHNEFLNDKKKEEVAPKEMVDEVKPVLEETKTEEPEEETPSENEENKKA